MVTTNGFTMKDWNTFSGLVTKANLEQLKLMKQMLQLEQLKITPFGDDE